MKASEFFVEAGNSIKSLVKVALKSRRTDIPAENRTAPLVVMANGPSLNETISQSLELLKASDTMSVNFAPLSEEFFDIKPKYHVLADPLFFTDIQPFNVEQLYQRLLTVDWPLAVFVPREFAHKAKTLMARNEKIMVKAFNFVGAGGFPTLERCLYKQKLAMPRPRNVLVPALMCAIWLGYKNVYIVGADHSWMRTISVDSENNVISVQPHFYKDDEREQRRVDTTYRNFRLHQIVESFAIAFRSYHILRRYADSVGVKIYNSTPDSFIDAFPRRELPEVDASKR